MKTDEGTMAGRKGQRSGGHNAKTTEQHKIDGTFQKCRHEKRADNLPAKGQPEKPDDLSEVEELVWSEMCNHLPAASIGRADTIMLREAARWYGIYFECMRLLRGDPIDKDLMGATDKAWKNFERIARDFGVTPVGRTRLELSAEDQAKPANRLHDLLASRN